MLPMMLMSMMMKMMMMMTKVVVDEYGAVPGQRSKEGSICLKAMSGRNGRLDFQLI